MNGSFFRRNKMKIENGVVVDGWFVQLSNNPQDVEYVVIEYDLDWFNKEGSINDIKKMAFEAAVEQRNKRDG